MEEKSYFEAKGMDLLNQLEQVLENDPLINEVGFIHPSQFIKLNEEVTISQPSSAGGSLQSANEIFKSGMLEINTLKQEDMVFWNRDHKLGISTEVLLPLYRAAKHAFMVAIQHYRICTGVSARDEKSKDGDKLCSFFSSQNTAESDVMRHSRALLLLSSDFGTAWNSRKLILSKKQGFSIYMNELLLSTMVLSYSPKSEHAWSHRRWAIRMIAGDCSNLQEIVNKESELVEKVAEKSKMNYRAWNYRCQLATYMTVAQVRCELKSSRNWAASHVADNCCFHYRRRLLCRLLEDYCSEQDVNASSGCRFDIYKVWKEELDWNEILILRYIGREALWLHRRFLSLCWIKHLVVNPPGVPFESEHKIRPNCVANNFLDCELQLLQRCTTIPDNNFDDFQAQAALSATYILWLTKEIPESHGIELQEKLRALDLKTLLYKACPEKTLFWSYSLGFQGSI